jgi:hypothetical protein
MRKMYQDGFQGEHLLCLTFFANRQLQCKAQRVFNCGVEVMVFLSINKCIFSKRETQEDTLKGHCCFF